jgi:hypothetical protein
LHAIADHVYLDLAMRNLVVYMIRLILKFISLFMCRDKKLTS